MIALKKYTPIIVFLPFIYILVLLCLSRYEYRQAGIAMKDRYYFEGMHPRLVRALEHLPLKTAPFFCQGDLQRIHAGLGLVLYEQNKAKKQNQNDYYVEMQKSLNHYQKSYAINPHDIFVVHGMAETTEALEAAHNHLFPGKTNKYNALPFFKRMAKIQPNGIKSNEAIISYLEKKGLKTELLSQVKHAAKIFPYYNWLKRESRYPIDTRKAIKEGFEQAIKENIMPNTAHLSLSTLFEADKDFSAATLHFKKAMVLKNTKQSSTDHLKLGTLLLKSGERANADREFQTALNKSLNPLSVIQAIHAGFNQEKDLNGFINFAAFAKVNKNIKIELDLFTAKTQMKMELYDSAKKTLESINNDKPNDKAFYQLSQLAKIQRDWDAMELNIQRATMLKPNNANYFKTLSDSLVFQHKYKSAASYLKKAIKLDPRNQNYKKRLNKIQSQKS